MSYVEIYEHRPYKNVRVKKVTSLHHDKGASYCVPAMRRCILFAGMFFDKESHIGMVSYYL